MTKILSVKRLAEIGGGFTPPISSIVPLFTSVAANATSLTDTNLINASVILLMRGILPLEQVLTAPTESQYTLNPVTGTLTFGVSNPTDAEQLYILYYPIISLGTSQAIEPITLAQAKQHLLVTFTDDDVEIYQLIARARKFIENYCSISIVTQQIQVVAEICGEFDLPYGPVISIESVETPSQSSGSGPVVYEASSNSWQFDGGTFGTPWFGDDVRHFSTRDRYGPYRTRITYTAGMDFVPADLIAAILAQVAWMYENRGNTTTQGASIDALTLAAPYRNMLWL